MERLPAAVRGGIAWAGRRFPTGDGKVSLSDRLRRFLRAADLPPEQAHFTWNGTWLSDEAASLVRPGADRDLVCAALPALAERVARPDGAALRGLQLADIAEYLPNDILAKVDRMSMAHGLETRAPFLDHELATWTLRLPEGLTVGGGGPPKPLLRAAARRIFGPAIADRPKQGFSIPVNAWIRGPLEGLVRDLLAPASVESLDVLDPSRVAAVVDDHLSGRNHRGFEIWGLAVLVAWHRQRIAQRPPAPQVAEEPVRLHF
jgi:asparagine synthase (glutamine-hydrolysing)